MHFCECNIKRSVENRRTLHSSGYFVLCTFGSEKQMKSSKYWNSLVSFNDSLIFIHLAYLECVSILLLSLSSSCTIDIKWWECEKKLKQRSHNLAILFVTLSVGLCFDNDLLWCYDIVACVHQHVPMIWIRMPCRFFSSSVRSEASCAGACEEPISIYVSRNAVKMINAMNVRRTEIKGTRGIRQ